LPKNKGLRSYQWLPSRQRKYHGFTLSQRWVRRVAKPVPASSKAGTGYVLILTQLYVVPSNIFRVDLILGFVWHF
jgi:hypothetical protein